MKDTKQINLKTQILGTLTLPTSIYVFYRIKKLRLGMLLHISSSIILASCFFNLMILISTANFGFYFIISSIITGLGFYLPIPYIVKWTREFNNKLLNQV